MATTPSPASSAVLTPERLRSARTALGMTQRQLADALDMSETTLIRWETGAADIGSPRRTLLALLALLDGWRADGSKGRPAPRPEGF